MIGFTVSFLNNFFLLNETVNVKFASKGIKIIDVMLNEVLREYRSVLVIAQRIKGELVC